MHWNGLQRRSFIKNQGKTERAETQNQVSWDAELSHFWIAVGKENVTLVDLWLWTRWKIWRKWDEGICQASSH